MATITFGYERASKTTNQELSPQQFEEAKMIVEKFRGLIGVLNSDPERGDRTTWFGSRNPPRVGQMIENFHRYINERCTRITFVAKDGEDFAHMKKTVKTGFTNDDSAHSKRLYGDLVKTETDDDYRGKGGYLLAPSGMRIFIESEYFTSGMSHATAAGGLHTQFLLRVNTLFHEMTHRVIRTIDAEHPTRKRKCYGYDICKDVALTHPDVAMVNADNWGYFMSAFWKNEGYGG